MRAAGLVAAAGRSERMGRTKALLHLDGETFVRHLARVMLRTGLDPVVVTVPEPPDQAAVARALAGLPLLVTRNDAPAEGLIGSVRTALARAGDVQALALCPVDMPFVTAPLLGRLLAAVDEGAAAAAPWVEGRRGHPVVFARALFGALLTAGDGGARAVLEGCEEDVARVPWGDARVLSNLNTPEDLARAFGEPPGEAGARARRRKA